MTLVTPAIQTLFDRDGNPLENGYIYVGESGQDAQTNPVQAYWDEDLTITAAQPIRTKGGYPVYQGTPTAIFVAEADCSITVKDRFQRPVLTNVLGQFSLGYMGFTQSGTGAVGRTALAKMREFVTPEDFGAVGDGSTNDGPAIQLALNTGKSVWCDTTKSYLVSPSVDVPTLSFTADGQKLFLNGATLYASGNFNLLSIGNGLRGCGIHQGTLDGTGHTGGYMIHLSDANRTFISDLTVHDPYNFLYGEKFNLLALNNVWVNNVTGDYGVHFYGEDGLRSDVAVFANVTISSHTTPKVAIGLLVDGLVHTINIQTMKLLNMNVGLQYKNSSGGQVPMFLFADNLEVEFSLNDGIDLQVGEHFYFTNLYSVSSTNASGVKVDASVPSGRISITNGDIVDNALYGVDNPSTRVQVSGLSMFDNLSGDFSGEAYVHAPIHQVDDDYYLRVLGSNPIINFAPTDYFEYDRATNRLFLRVGGNDRFAVNSTGVEVYVNAAMKTLEVGAADSGGPGYRTVRVTN